MKFSVLKAWIFGHNPFVSENGYPSVNRALKRILGGKDLEKILKRIPDRRQVMEEAAKLKALPENELIKMVAEILDLPVFFRPRPFDLSVLPENISLPDLRRCGVCPLVQRGSICGVVCIDPAELNQLEGFYCGNNIYLTSWQAVLSALYLSEQSYLTAKHQAEQKISENEKQIFEKILLKLVDDMKFRESAELQFLPDQSGLSYQFIDAQGGEWSGRIDDKVSVKFIDYLEHRIAANQIEVRTEQQELVCTLTASNGQIYLRECQKVSQEDCKIIRFPLPGTEASGGDDVQPESGSATVLLLDDNPSYVEVLQRYLIRQGFNVECFQLLNSVIERLQAFDRTLPDIIVSDLHLADGCGYNFVQKIKSSDRLKAIPVVVLTSAEQSEIRALELGADAFVTKTKDPRILTLHIKRLLGYRIAA